MRKMSLGSGLSRLKETIYFESAGSFGMKLVECGDSESVCTSLSQILDILCLQISTPGLPVRADAELPVWLCGHPADISGR